MKFNKNKTLTYIKGFKRGAAICLAAILIIIVIIKLLEALDKRIVLVLLMVLAITGGVFSVMKDYEKRRKNNI